MASITLVERRLSTHSILTYIYIYVKSFEDLVLKYGRRHTFIVSILEFIFCPMCIVTLKQLLRMWLWLHIKSTILNSKLTNTALQSLRVNLPTKDILEVAKICDGITITSATIKWKADKPLGRSFTKNIEYINPQPSNEESLIAYQRFKVC